MKSPDKLRDPPDLDDRVQGSEPEDETARQELIASYRRAKRKLRKYNDKKIKKISERVMS
jgi:hypothetical protein